MILYRTPEVRGEEPTTALRLLHCSYIVVTLLLHCAVWWIKSNKPPDRIFIFIMHMICKYAMMSSWLPCVVDKSRFYYRNNKSTQLTIQDNRGNWQHSLNIYNTLQHFTTLYNTLQHFTTLPDIIRLLRWVTRDLYLKGNTIAINLSKVKGTNTRTPAFLKYRGVHKGHVLTYLVR